MNCRTPSREYVVLTALDVLVLDIRNALSIVEGCEGCELHEGGRGRFCVSGFEKDEGKRVRLALPYV